MVRALCELDEKVEIVVPDLTYVHRLVLAGVCLLVQIRAACARDGGDVAVVDYDGDLTVDFRVLNPDIPAFNTRDTAVAWVQDRLLATHGQGASSAHGD